MTIKGNHHKKNSELSARSFLVLGTSINCHSEHREESQFVFECIIEMFRFAQHDIFRNYLLCFSSAIKKFIYFSIA